jgi:hypothetical protein
MRTDNPVLSALETVSYLPVILDSPACASMIRRFFGWFTLKRGDRDRLEF